MRRIFKRVIRINNKTSHSSKKNKLIITFISILIIVSAVILWYFLYFNKVNNEKSSRDKDTYIKSDGQKISNKQFEESNNLSNNVEQEKFAVKEVITSWLNCWQNKDLNCYKSYITKDYIFISEGLKNPVQNYNERINTLSKHFKEWEFIHITYKNMSITINGNNATVTYFQEYTSDKFSDRGDKTIQLRKESKNWLIYSETFQKR